MFRFDLSDQMVMVVIQALGNHPYREAAPVIMELQRQISTQRGASMSMPGNGKVHAEEAQPAQ